MIDPTTGRPICSECRGEISPVASGVWVKIEGWAQNRNEGGAHAVAERQSLGEWVHGTCWALRKLPESRGQGSLI